MQIVFNSNTLSEVDLRAPARSVRNSCLPFAANSFCAPATWSTKNMATGELEVLVSEFKILSKSETTPFEITDDCKANELLRLKYRYLDLRRPASAEESHHAP